MKTPKKLFLTSLICLSLIGSAQTGFDDDIDDMGNEEEESAPVDGGILYLIAGAAAFGLKTYRDQKETLALQEQDKRLH